jgi:hypothetical protein
MVVKLGSLLNGIGTGVTGIVGDALTLDPVGIVSDALEMAGGIVAAVAPPDSKAINIIAAAFNGATGIVSTATDPLAWINSARIVESAGDLVGNVVNAATSRSGTPDRGRDNDRNNNDRDNGGGDAPPSAIEQLLSTATTAVANHKTVTGTSGNDVLADGRHSDVTLRGGAGNDVACVSHAKTSVDGGQGYDVLLVTKSGLKLDLDHVKGIEQIELGSGSRLSIDLRDVLKGPDATDKALVVTGDASDTVVLGKGFTHAAGDTQVIDGMAFDIWHAGRGDDVATLLLEQGMHAQVTS